MAIVPLMLTNPMVNKNSTTDEILRWCRTFETMALGGHGRVIDDSVQFDEFGRVAFFVECPEELARKFGSYYSPQH